MRKGNEQINVKDEGSRKGGTEREEEGEGLGRTKGGGEGWTHLTGNTVAEERFDDDG